MSSKPTDIDALKIEIAEDGTATLSGMNYTDLRNIITAASLHRHANPFKAEPLRGMNDADDRDAHRANLVNALWYLDQELIMGSLRALLNEAIRPGYGDGARGIESAKVEYQRHLDWLEKDVREAEAKAAAERDEKAQKPDPLHEIAVVLRTVVRQADGALAQLERVRASGHA